MLAHPDTLPVAVGWAARLARRASLRILRRVHPTTNVMHSFMDARDVAPAWELLRRGVAADDPGARATQ